MKASVWLLFSSLALAGAISPGPAVLLSVTNSLTHGFIKSIFSSLGNITGLFLVSMTAALGLGAVLQTSVLLFSIFKFLGAFYLIYLGIHQWRSKLNVFKNSIKDLKHQRYQGNRKLFFQGLVVAISNPKAIIFFTAFFPQFIDLSKPVLVQFIILTITFMLFSFMSLLLYALTARSFKDWFGERNRAIWFNRISGTIFISFGLGLIGLRNRTV